MSEPVKIILGKLIKFGLVMVFISRLIMVIRCSIFLYCLFVGLVSCVIVLEVIFWYCLLSNRVVLHLFCLDLSISEIRWLSSMNFHTPFGFRDASPLGSSTCPIVKSGSECFEELGPNNYIKCWDPSKMFFVVGVE